MAEFNHGILDEIRDNTLVGWASYGPEDRRSPQLELLIDGQPVAQCEGTLNRPGVKQRGLHPSGCCGFNFSLDLIPETLRNETQIVSVRLIQPGQAPIELRNSPKALVWNTHYDIPAVKKLFFMHIAKAAGTSANHMMAGLYSPLSGITHIETQFRDWPSGHARQFDFVSGHIEAPVASKLGLKNHVWVTLFRKPKPHLFSHINWLRHIGSDPDSEFHKAHSGKVRELALRLAAVEPGDNAALSAALDDQDPTVRTLFDNRQTRYLLPRNTSHVDDSSMARAFKQLDAFDLVGAVEQIEVFNQELKTLLNTQESTALPSLNRAPSENPLRLEDFDEELILPFIRHDREIYKDVLRRVRQRRGLQDTGKKHELARQPKPHAYLLPQLQPVDTATHPSRQPCSTLTPATGTAQKTLIVLGVSRGGTSMVAGLLSLLGVSMGETLSAGSHEDPAFHTRDVAALRKLVDQRNAQHDLWGWKYPHTLDYLGKIHGQLRNPHFVVIYRDAMSVAQAFQRADGTDLKIALKDAQRRYDKLTRFCLDCEDPLMTISYEKAINNPNALLRELARFCGVSMSLELKARCLQFIEPGRYVALQSAGSKA
ncbi:Lipopolysaccharide biosynthesis protein [Oceanococcus atlanticus]|uniref:Lipopolysaccharide biosynthesis protein n=1 Tax=Oceanococcus atlanticus TaxID=1317117 RepID=A0A1Y1S9Y2_9GAMM|nr:sulfotransferase [Oceanococcus atlanticus]ORE85148.1 Lipopolysaccharide biosynthesis protein [Oceanococcus atlanticus]